MRSSIVFRASAKLVACAAAVTFASPALAAPPDQIPGTGAFRVGVDMAPGTYHTDGAAGTGQLCSWQTFRSPGMSYQTVIDGNVSAGPMTATVPETAAAFETTGCRPWHTVP